MGRCILIGLLGLGCVIRLTAIADNEVAVGESGACNFDTRGRTIDSLSGFTVHLGGALLKPTVWAAGEKHVVFGSIVVNPNATLTIEKDAEVRFVGGGIVAWGKCNANGSRFGDIDDVASMACFTLDGNVEIDAKTRLDCLDSQLGWTLGQESDSIVFDTRGYHPSDFASHCIHFGGALSEDEVWTSDRTHIVYGSVDIPADVALTVEADAVVKFVGGGIVNHGSFIASGARFADLNDDTIGGDAMGDGWTQPLPSYSVEGNVVADANTIFRCVNAHLTYSCDSDMSPIAFDTRGLNGCLPDDSITHWGGTLSGDETWSAGAVHVVYGAINVPTGVKLTIEQGAIVRFIGGGLMVDGVCIANGVSFMDFADGCLPSFTLEGNVETDEDTITAGCRTGLDYTGHPGVSRVFRLELEPYRFAGDQREVTFGAFWDGSSTVSVTETGPDGSTIVLTNGNSEAAGVFLWDAGQAPGLYTLRHITDTNVLEAFFYRLINASVHNGALTGTNFWAAGTIHVLNGNVTVGVGAELSIEEGAIVKAMPGAKLVVNESGRCIAKGVTFTHVADDAKGGDMLADGPVEDVPENDYLIVGYIEDDAETEYRYAQRSLNGTIAYDTEWDARRVYVIDGTLTVASGVSLTIPKGTVVKFTDGSTLSVENGGVCMAEGAIFTHIADDAAGGDTLGDGTETQPKYGAYTIAGNVIDDDFTEYRYTAPITLSGTISKNTSWRARGVYQVTGNLTIASGVTLAIQPGAIIKFGAGMSLTVSSGATLNALGTRAAPIVFTSIKDDEFGGDTNGDGDATKAQPGDWYQIRVQGTANFDYTKVFYNSSTENYGGIEAYGGTVLFDNSELAHTKYECVNAHSSGSFVAHNSVLWDASLGFGYYGSGKVKAFNCVFAYMTAAVRQSGKELKNCIFYACSSFTDQNGDGSSFANSVFYNPAGVGAQNYSRCGSDGNVWADPKFLDPDNGDFRVAEDSPCLDAGDTAMAPARDYYGQPRVGAAADIGIYEIMPRYVASDVDLRALNVNVASSVVVGDELTVSWTVANNGTAPVYDSWWDKLELVSSRGERFPLGERLMKSGLAAGGQRSCSASWKMPVVSEGEYTVLVTVNYARDVFEGTLTENNVMSSGGVKVSVPTVAATDGAALKVGANDEGVMHFTLGADSADRLITIGAADGVRALFGTTGVPTENYNVGSVKASEGTICFIVPEGATDVYVRLANEGNGDVDCTAAFSTAKVKILDVTPRTVPYDGKVTVRVEGAGLNRIQSVAFRAADATLVPCENWRMDSSGLIVVSADGTTLAQGAEYQLALTDDKGEQVDSELRLSVTQEPAKPEVWAKMNVPETVRDGRQYLCTIEYGNKGNADAVAPLLQVSVRGGGTVRTGKDDEPSDDLVFVGVGGSGNAGVLVPGEVKKVEFLYNAGSSSDKMTLRVGEDDQVAAAAVRMALRGEDATDYFAAKELADRIAVGEPCGVYYGYVRDADGYPVSGYYVTITNGEGEVVADAVSDEKGHYATEACMDNDLRQDVVIANAPSDSYVEVLGADEGTVVVAIDRHSGVTYAGERGTDGLYRFRGIDEGVYMVVASGGDKLAVGMIYVEEGAHYPLSLKMDRTGGIHGTFVGDGSETDPTILLFGCGIDRIVHVSSDGTFAFEGLPSGSYAVMFAGDNMDDYSAEWELAVSDGETVACEIVKTNNMVAASAMAAVRVGDMAYSLMAVNALKSVRHYVTEDNIREYRIMLRSYAPDPPPSDRNCAHNKKRYRTAVTMYRWMTEELVQAECLKEQIDDIQQQILMQGWDAAVILAGRYMAVGKAFKNLGRSWKLAQAGISLTGDVAGIFIGLEDDLSKMDSILQAVSTSVTMVMDTFTSPLALVEYVRTGQAETLTRQLKELAGCSQRLRRELAMIDDELHLINKVGEIMEYVSAFVGILDAIRLYRDRTDLYNRLNDLRAELDADLYLVNSNIDSVMRDIDYPLCCPKDDPPPVTTPPVQTNEVKKVVSWDPNEVSGPIGLGDPETERFMRPGEWMTYTVYFENASNATAGAQEVFVTNPLSEWLDWETFEMGEVVFANQTDIGLSGLQVGKCETDMVGTAYKVQSNVSIDKQTGVVDWYLRLVDPATASGWPEDPYAGFLQPNDETHCGEGHLTYRIKIREDAPRNAIIENAATIIFDYNEEIPTDPSWWNTVGWPLTIGESVNNEELTWFTGGATNWMPVLSDVAFDGQHESLVGGIANNTNSWIKTVVEGPGTVSFAWCAALASRNTKMQFLVDGAVEGILVGTNEWETLNVTVFGEGEHELTWRLITGRSGSSEDDSAALDVVIWLPTPPPTLAEALNPALKWNIDGYADWHGVARDSLVSTRESWASVSGLGDFEYAAVESRVYGSGTLRFDWAVSCEEEYDELVLVVDGKRRKSITGEVGWKADAVEIAGKAWHTIRWEYVKDDLDEPELVGDNRAMLDNVVWVSDDEPPRFTETTPVPVPFEEIDAKFRAYLNAAGGDYEAAALAIGKNGYAIWEAYVAGLNPEDELSQFKVKIEIVNGEPKITWVPDLNENGTKNVRKYTTLGSENLGGEWKDISDVQQNEKEKYRFFKVSVGMP